MEKDYVKTLQRNKNKYVCLLECLDSGDYETLVNNRFGVVISSKSAKLTMIEGNNFEKLTENLTFEENYHYFTTNSKIAKGICKKINKEYRRCYQVIYNDLPIKNIEGLKVYKAENTYENAKFISSRYTLGYSPENTYKTMNKTFFLFAEYNGAICGFIGMHEERSIGFLEVFPEYRRLGIGSILIEYAVKEVKNMGKTPFSHIIATNRKSYNLHQKLDCEIYKKYVYWI